MTDEEFAAFELELEATFRGDLAEDRVAALREHFGRVPFELARRVIARLVMAGQVFMPTPGELVTALRGVTGGGWDFACAINGQTSEERQAWLEERVAHNLGQARRRPELERG